MSNFNSDLNQEEILSRYLDAVYKVKGFEFQRIADMEKQHRGVDILISKNNVEYVVDEKAQLHYLNKDLPTFTFELSYLKDKLKKEGWLFDKNKITQYYFLVTGIFLKNGQSTLKTPDDIHKLKITSVNRSKLIKHLDSIGLNNERLSNYDKQLRAKDAYGKNSIDELDANHEGLIYFTQHLEEKPINLQLRLEYLLNVGVAKRFHYV